MIIATAGHVDHGKTSLLRALTGVDADRLPEEKKRGLTIDLGFVYDDKLCPGTVIGFVDVPGHERFIHNMLAGVTAIRAAMLVVAADDGPMPQTREHLDILDLVGVREGFVALTKTDLADPELTQVVKEEIGEMLAGRSLDGAPVFPVSSTTGDGVAAIAAHLKGLAETERRAEPAGNFRLAVDRAFTVAGAGLVVTGLVHTGSIAAGDTVLLSPAGKELRVRGLRAQDREVASARQGDRCAINLSGGIRKDDIARGDWIVAEPAHLVSRRLDARIRVLAGEKRSLKHWTPAHIHVGTADITGRIALLEGKEIAPGKSGLVQLVLDAPVAASWGDIAIVRDQSARRTIGGGPIIDPLSPARGRVRPARLAWVRGMEHEDIDSALRAVVEAAPGGAPLHTFAAVRNLTPAEADDLYGAADICCLADDVAIGLSQTNYDKLLAAILETLRQWHADKADAGGVNEATLFHNLPHRPHPAAFDHALADLIGRGAVRRAGPLVHLPGHEARLSAADDKLWRQAEAIMAAATEKPPTVFELSQEMDLDRQKMGRLLAQAAKLGLAMRVSPNRYMSVPTLLRLARAAEDGARQLPEGRFTAAAYRDWSGMGRNLSIEILEFFDKVGFTRRIGNEREIRRPAAAVFDAGPDEDPPRRPALEGAPARSTGAPQS